MWWGSRDVQAQKGIVQYGAYGTGCRSVDCNRPARNSSPLSHAPACSQAHVPWMAIQRLPPPVRPGCLLDHSLCWRFVRSSPSSRVAMLMCNLACATYIASYLDARLRHLLLGKELRQVAEQQGGACSRRRPLNTHVCFSICSFNTIERFSAEWNGFIWQSGSLRA